MASHAGPGLTSELYFNYVKLRWPRHLLTGFTADTRRCGTCSRVCVEYGGWSDLLRLSALEHRSGYCSVESAHWIGEKIASNVQAHKDTVVKVI